MKRTTKPKQCPRVSLSALAIAVTTLVAGGCALQPAYTPPTTTSPSAWSVPAAEKSAADHTTMDRWWNALHDPAVDVLVDLAMVANPTLAQTVARIDEARATLGLSASAGALSLSASASTAQAQVQNTAASQQGITMRSHSADFGPALNREVDLFGRIRHSVDAAQYRLDARTADAATVRLSLAADVVGGVLYLRACEHTGTVLADDLASREKTLALTRRKLLAGSAAPADEARGISGIAAVHTKLAAQKEQCTRQLNALAALTGKDAATVREQIFGTGAISSFMPSAPNAAPELPAIVLARHPSVVSADREAAAAWEEIGVARANRLPRLDLAAVLTGQWVRAAGSSFDFTTWSIGPALTGTVLDGGAGAANVNAAEARYRRAVAGLQGTLRSTVQEVENALAAQASAQDRTVSAGEAVTAARTTLRTSESQWQAGTISLFELEDSRRQFASAQDDEISARRDHALAWVGLIKASAGAITATP